MCKATIPGMRTGGAIVNVSSLAARTGGEASAVHYAAAKAGVLTMTRGLANEVAPKGIRVNCVEAGVIASTFHDVFTKPEVRENFSSMIPLGQEGEAREVAEVVAFLVTNPPLLYYGRNNSGKCGVVFYLRIEPRNNHIC